MNNTQNSNTDFLYNAILELRTVDECCAFFKDLCTREELRAISQRIVVAKMLRDHCVYSDIVAKTGASTATISRVNRTLQTDDEKYVGGYEKIFERIDGKK